MRYKKAYLGLGLLLMSFVASDSVEISNFSFSGNFNKVNDIALEDDTLWLATAGGVLKADTSGNVLDNNDTSAVSISSYTHEVEIDKNGCKWFGTDHGIIQFDGKTWEKHLNGYRVISLAIDNLNHKWLGCYYGALWEYDDSVWIKHYNPSETEVPIDAIAIDEDGYKWFSFTDYVVVCKYKSWFDVKYYDGWATSAGELQWNRHYAIEIDHIGNIWISDMDGIVKFDGNSWSKKHTGCFVRAIKTDYNNNLWCGTDGNGLMKYDGANWTTYDTSNGLSDNYISSVTLDKQGNKWLGTKNNGVTVLKYNGVGIDKKGDARDGSLFPDYKIEYNPTGTIDIEMELAISQNVRVAVYNMAGNCIKQTHDYHKKGTYNNCFKIQDISEGMYVCLIGLGRLRHSISGKVLKY